MKQWLAVLTALMMMVTAAMPVAATDTATYSLAEDATVVTAIGRCAVGDNGIEAYTTGAGIAFYADCAGDVSVTISGQSSKWNMQCFSVFVDGEEQERLQLAHPINRRVTETLTVATGLTDGMHRIEIYRDSEEVYGECVFEEVTVSGTIAPVPEAPLMIEFIGDSMTCGYASYPQENTSLSVEHPLWEAGSKTYAYECAQALGADFQSVCASGYGVVCGWNGDGVTLGDMYVKTSYYHNDTAWGFERQADVVVINLLTNDNMRMLVTGHTAEDIHDGITTLTETVRENNPDAKIVWVYGLMGSYFVDGIIDCVESLGGADAGYFACELPKGTSGGASHPSIEEHAAAGEVLAEFLQAEVLTDYADGLWTIEDAKAIPAEALTEQQQKQLALEIAVAEKSGAMTGALTALCNTFELSEEAPATTTVAATTTTVPATTTDAADADEKVPDTGETMLFVWVAIAVAVAALAVVAALKWKPKA